MKKRVLIVPDWLDWITGTIAKAHMRWNSDYDCDVVPVGVLLMAIQEGWKPWEEFDVVHLLTTRVAMSAGEFFLGRLPTATTLHHVHDEADVPFDTSGDAIMVSGSQWEKWLLERGTEETHIVQVPYGVDADKFRPASSEVRCRIRRKWGLSENEIAIGFTGKKGSDDFGRKGFDIYCAGIAALADKGISVVAFVLGSGWQGEMKELLPEKVRRIHVPHIDDQREVYHAMDVYWVASRVEGGPVPLLEAMSSGVVCVCNKVGMVEDVVTDGVDGFVTHDTSPREFAEITEELLAVVDRHKKMKAAARQKIVEKFDWSKVGTEAAHLYERTIENFVKRHGSISMRRGGNSDVLVREEKNNRQLMWSIPKRIRARALVEERLKMVRELFRVRNRRAATIGALRVMMEHPRHWYIPASVIVVSWKGEATVVLGRWKQRIVFRAKGAMDAKRKTKG